MTRTSPDSRRLAERLLGHEADAYEAGAEGGAAAFRVGEKLRNVLAVILGSSGFRTVLMRALTLAQSEAPELIAVRVRDDGSLEGTIKPGRRSDERPVAEAEVVLIGRLVGLLVDFIGEELVMSLVLEAWPKGTFRGLKGTSDG
jgi:hypothetical protein